MFIVTGGAGFIGSALVWKLNSMGVDDILIVDRLGRADKWKNLRALKYSDYMEKDVFRAYIECSRDFTDADIECILHMGACSATTEQDASYLVDNNYNYTKALASFALEKGIDFVYASSAATYGDGSNGYEDDEDALESLRPMNMYGYSKHLFDLWARRKGLLDKITGLKFTNVFGPNELHKADMRSVMCRAFGQIRENGKIRLFKSYRREYADGEQKRDFLYVKDAVDMVVFLMKNKKRGIYNIGSGKAETWNSLAEAAFKAMELETSIEYIDMPFQLRDRYQYFTKAEMSKLRNAGYSKDTTPLEKALEDYYRNYLVPGKYLGD